MSWNTPLKELWAGGPLGRHESAADNAYALQVEIEKLRKSKGIAKAKRRQAAEIGARAIRLGASYDQALAAAYDALTGKE